MISEKVISPNDILYVDITIHDKKHYGAESREFVC